MLLNSLLKTYKGKRLTGGGLYQFDESGPGLFRKTEAVFSRSSRHCKTASLYHSPNGHSKADVIHYLQVWTMFRAESLTVTAVGTSHPGKQLHKVCLLGLG